MKKLVITTVGTSLGGLKKLNGDCQVYLKNLSVNNILTADNILNTADLSIERFLQQFLKYLYSVNELKDFPAEIASLKLMELKTDDKIILLCSDTPEGAFCGLINQKFIIEQMKIKCDLRIIEGLDTKESNKFLQGLQNLIIILHEYHKASEETNCELVINITGGYKGSIPIISFFAKNNQLKIFYLHQESTLVEIPPNLVVKSRDDLGRDNTLHLRTL